MKQNIIIYSLDPEYGEALAGGLNKDRDFPFYVTAVQKERELEERTSEETIDILLLDKQIDYKKVSRYRIGQIFYLTDVQGYHSVDAIPVIYKYQPLTRIREIIQKEQSVYENEGAGNERNVSRCSFVGIASPIGRINKTSFSLIYGSLLSQSAKVLYVNLEPFSGFEKLFEKHFEETLSDVIYAHEIEDTKFEIGKVLENFHGLQVIPPVHLAEDLFQCKPETIREILIQLAREELFDVVLIDFGSQYQYLPVFLPVLTRLFVPKTAKASENFKLEEFTAYIKRVLKGEEKEIVEIELPQSLSHLTGKAYLEQLMWNEMGDRVRKLIGGIS